MGRRFRVLQRASLEPVYAIYPWMPDLNTSIQPEDRNQFEQALFARTTRLDLPQNVKPLKGADSADTSGRSTLHSLNRESFPSKVQSVARAQEHGLQTVSLMWKYAAIALALIFYAGLWVFLSRQALLWFHVLGACMGVLCFFFF